MLLINCLIKEVKPDEGTGTRRTRASHAARIEEGGRSMVLQSIGKLLQAAVESCRIIPERCVSRVRHDLNLSVRQAGLVLIYNGRLDHCIVGTMRDQYGPADLRQQIVIVERARE